jgi:hypothetical protein
MQAYMWVINWVYVIWTYYSLFYGIFEAYVCSD